MSNAGKKAAWDKLDIPSRFDEIEQWCREGVIERDICKNLGVGVTTFNQWKKDHIEINEVLKKGKAIADQIVISKLYARAVGYEYEEQREETFQDEKGNHNHRTVIIKKQMAPDVTAQIFWLKNRRPDEWRDKKNIEEEVGFTGTIDEAREEVKRRLHRLFDGYDSEGKSNQ